MHSRLDIIKGILKSMNIHQDLVIDGHLVSRKSKQFWLVERNVAGLDHAAEIVASRYHYADHVANHPR